jgi:hypothetical protein
METHVIKWGFCSLPSLITRGYADFIWLCWKIAPAVDVVLDFASLDSQVLL